ncbi:MAG: O-antigen ligase family protein [bacterium]|nr:O-antigen ligase family protein [bacterium]
MKNLQLLIQKIKEPRIFGPILIYLLLVLAAILKLNLAFLTLAVFLLVSFFYFKNYLLAFYLAVFSLSFDQIYISVGFSLKIHMVVFLITFLLLLYNHVKERRLPTLPPRAFSLPLVVFLAFALLSVYFALDQTRSLRFFANLVYDLTVFGIVFALVADSSRVLKTILALLLGTLVTTVVAIYQFVAFYLDIDFYTKVNILNPGTFARPKGIFDHTNFLANFLLVSLPIGLSVLVDKTRENWWRIFLVGAGISALAITFSRAAWIALLGALLIFIFGTVILRFNLVALLSKFAVVGLTSLVMLVVLLVAIGPLQFGGLRGRSHVSDLERRISSSVDPEATTNTERLQIWQAGIKMVKANWLTGVGLENFMLRYHDYKLPEAKRDRVQAHNVYLQILAETGVFGFWAFLWFNIALIVSALLSLFQSKDWQMRLVVLGSLTAVLAVSFQNLTNSTLYYPHTWFLYGFLLASSRLALKKE